MDLDDFRQTNLVDATTLYRICYYNIDQEGNHVKFWLNSPEGLMTKDERFAYSFEIQRAIEISAVLNKDSKNYFIVDNSGRYVEDSFH